MTTNCIACNLHLRSYASFISICPRCGLGQTKTSSTVSYRNYYRDVQYLQNSSQFRNIFAKRVTIINRFKKPGLALEIGSSSGELLKLLQNTGWQVLGVEPSKKSFLAAIVPTLHTTFDKAELKKHSFDLIVLNHVLEHLESPFQVLKKCYGLLSPQGLVFIDVPNFGSLSSRVLRSWWPYLLVGEHRWHLTYPALKTLLEHAGFKIIHWETRSGIWDYGSPGQELIDSLVSLKKRFITNFLTAIPSWIISQLKLGTSLTVIG